MLVVDIMELDELISQIKNEMAYWYGFDLTREQITDYVIRTNIDCFDTVERDDYASKISTDITGMKWPYNGSPQAYKDEFIKRMKENIGKSKYKLL